MKCNGCLLQETLWHFPPLSLSRAAQPDRDYSFIFHISPVPRIILTQNFWRCHGDVKKKKKAPNILWRCIGFRRDGALMTVLKGHRGGFDEWISRKPLSRHEAPISVCASHWHHEEIPQQTAVGRTHPQPLFICSIHKHCCILFLFLRRQQQTAIYDRWSVSPSETAFSTVMRAVSMIAGHFQVKDHVLFIYNGSAL